jgi:hypothetical protein
MAVDRGAYRMAETLDPCGHTKIMATWRTGCVGKEIRPYRVWHPLLL